MLGGVEQEDSSSPANVLPSPHPPTTPPLVDPHPPITASGATITKTAATIETETTIVTEIEAVPTGTTQAVEISGSSSASQTSLDAKGKRTPRQWDAWTHEEEETFFIALRHVGKNFEKITNRVQSKNKDQVRHYYYRLIRRINKLLGPDFSLDAKNTKDANTAMLRWWSLLEKESCSASKLYLKPRRFKTFVTALEQQIMKDRMKASKKHQQIVSATGGPVIASAVRKSCACGSESTKTVAIEVSRGSKSASEHVSTVKQTIKASNQKKKERSQPPRKRKKGADGNVSTAAMKKWEKAASAGVSLVAEAAEQLERAAAEKLGQTGPVLQVSRLCTTNDMEQEAPEDLNKLGPKETIEATEHVVEGITEEETQASKLKLQLYPIDEGTRKCMEQDGLNPYLELTLKPRKAMSSVIRHLSQKWGRTSAAAGQLHLFPYSQDSKSISSGQGWSIEQTTSNAGDVFAVLGSPSVFRLRYAWIPCRASQSSRAECSQVPVSSSIREGMQVEENLRNEAFNDPSKVTLPKPKSSSLSALENVSTILSREQLYVSSEILRPKDSGKLENNILPEGKVDSVTETNAEGVKAVAIRRKIEHPKDTSMHADVLIQVDARNAINNFGQGSPVGLLCHDSGQEHDKVLHKVQENGRNVRSSWLYDGSNDSFVQRIWAVEDAANETPILPTEIDWVDSLTNISVSEFLNEVSQAGHLNLGAGSTQALQPLQSLDSFDAAVAAQSHNMEHHPETSAWDGEETRDAFTFRKFVSQKLSTVPMQCGSEPQNFSEPLRESDAMILPFADCGSLEAWRQSFSHTELGILEDPKSDSNSRFLRQQLGKGSCSQDFILFDSLGVMSPGLHPLGSSKDEQHLSRYKSVGATTCDTSLDALQAYGAHGSVDNNCSAASCGLQSS